MSNKQRESFLFYRDWWKSLQEVDEDIRHDVMDAVMAYVFEGETIPLSPLARMAFSFIKPTLERDKEKYDNICEKRRAAGKKHKGNQYKKTSAAKTEDQDEEVTEQTTAEDNTQTSDSQEDLGEYMDVKLDSFAQIWNDEIEKRKNLNLPCFMKPIDLLNVPDDAISRLNNIHKWIIRQRVTSDLQVDKILLECGLNVDAMTKEQKTKELAAKMYVVRAMKNLAKVTMNPKNNLFGTFQWFCNAQNVHKLYNGDIQ